MNAITRADTEVSAQTMEHVLGTGDLSKLNSQQRVEYMLQVCKTVGLNPLTRPFRFMNFQGQTTMYATRDCADQLRSTRKIDISLIEKRLEGDLFIVTAQAKTPEGRQDEDVGAVTLGKLQGEARANAIMKAITKAKRRVTLSICGLGFLDESEVETLQGAATFDADKRAFVSTARAISDDLPDAMRGDYGFMTRQGGRMIGTAIEWIAAWEKLIANCKAADALDKLAAAKEMNAPAIDAVSQFDSDAANTVLKMLSDALPAAVDNGWPGPVPENAEHAAA